MKPFRFPLQGVLEFRASKLADEERKVGILQQELAGLNKAVENIERVHHDSARVLSRAEQLSSEELRALANFRAKLTRDRKELNRRKSACTRRLVRQRETYMAARREQKLLEKLRKKRFTDWSQAANRELDKVATELHLARWHRENKPRRRFDGKAQ